MNILTNNRFPGKKGVFVIVGVLFILAILAFSVNTVGQVASVDKKLPYHTVASVGANTIVKLISVNDAVCVLLDSGKVYCWGKRITGDINLGQMQQVDLGEGGKAVSIYGHSGEMEEFDVGYHACAVLKTGDIRCWGVSDDAVFNVDDVFEENKQARGIKKGIMSLQIKDSVVRKMDSPVKLITGAGVVCSIDKSNKLYCPHKHLAFLNGKPEIKDAIFGEVLTCLHKLSGQVECYDMRGTSNKKPIIVSFNGELNPHQLVSRIIYTFGTCIINSEKQLACWDGDFNRDIEFSYLYNIETALVKLPSGLKAQNVQMTDTHACVLLSDGSANCWGRNHDGQLGEKTKAGYIPAPGKRIKFASGNKIKSIAIGHGYSCFHVKNNVECFGKIYESKD